MAKPSWLNINPMQGSGNGTINNSASEHTGRVARVCTVTVTGVGVSTPDTYRVILEPKSEFVSYDNGDEMAIPKEGGNFTVTGKSNSSKLTFQWLNTTDVTIPSSYMAGGMTTNNGSNIEGDPGASSEYIFSIELDFPSNDVTEDVRTLVVKANGGQAAQITIKQAAEEATLSVTPKEITIPQDGSAVSVYVKSNTSWVVS